MENSNGNHENIPVKVTELSRKDVRALIYHLLYSVECFDYQSSLNSIVANYNRFYDLDIAEDGEVFNITESVIESRKKLDEVIKPLLANWKLERLSVSTHLILRLAIWELLNTDIAPNIVLNEAIELSKGFSEKDAYKFVNGVLDEALKHLDELKKHK
ncbi:MAG: N utilization substance protein B-like protein [candidate division TM6 bacterium GW2011_GWF2_32_72]|nr:MAG: N utilization substance protein B-like protein [candidate division TM6 bacterium GW2011_GWF2_32_72]